MADMPRLEELRPLKEMAAAIGLSVRAAHRWRMNRDTPLRAWKGGQGWMTTEAECLDFVRRRTERATGVAIEKVATRTSASRRKREAEAADARAASAGW